jgi:hypothetical protein
MRGDAGLIEEANEVVQEKDNGTGLDLGIIAGAQRVEHYEISAYGTARTMAERLGNNEAANLLRETEDEEKQTDRKLTEVANGIYDAQGEEEEEDDLGMTGEEEGSGMIAAGSRSSGRLRSSSSSKSSSPSRRSAAGRSSSSRGGNGSRSSSTRGRRSR